MANKIQLRRDTAANWTRINPILADGEPGLDITNNKLKMGDGTTAWSSLPYLVAGGETNSLVAGEYAAVLGTDGVLTVPGVVDATDGVTISTGRGDVQFGANLEAPGVPAHFHINKAGADAGYMDLILGDDSDYVKLPSGGGVIITADGTSSWEFTTGGTVLLPPNGVVTTGGASDGTAFNIIEIDVDTVNNNQITVTVNGSHGLNDSDKIYISGITTTTELNGSYYYVRPSAINDFLLYSDVDLTSNIDGSGFTAYNSTGNRPLTYDTAFNGHTIAGSESPFGAGYNSIRFNGGGWIEAAASNDFTIGTQDFAVSFWVKQIEYTGNTRLFNFGSWPGEILGMSSESNTTTYTWLNGTNIGDGLGGIQLDTWNHVLITRYLGNISICLNAVKGNTFSGSTYNLSNTQTVPLTIGGSNAHQSLLNGWIRDFKIDVGQGIDPDTFTLPTGPATANAYTKILVVGNDNFDDTSNGYTIAGGGIVTPKLPGGDIEISTVGAPNGSDPGDVRLSTSGNTQLKIDGKRDRVVITDPGGDYPINTTGQYDIVISADNADAQFTIMNPRINLVYITPFEGFSSVNTQTVQLPTPEWPGVEMTVINETAMLVDVIGWDGPGYNMQANDTIKLISYRAPTGQLYWWVTSAWVW